MEHDTASKAEPQPGPSLVKVKDSQLIGIVIAVLVIFITLVLLAIWRRQRSARRGILLVGLSDSGKTLIFSRLLHSKYVLTHTSIKENIEDLVLNNSSLRIVDIPGHERLRAKFFEQYKPIARGIVFVIDSVTFQKDIRDVAEYLYTLLSEPSIKSNVTPFLVLCNKQDQTMAKGSKVIQALLEKEMNLLRQTKSSQLESINSAETTTHFLGKKGKDFEFAHLHPQRVEFAESSACDKDTYKPAELNELKTWLQKIA
ncbi:signal recognition particle receptor subunit beta-like [Schistocerca gregaria]|uniref:signal recognition particle receptor subunit beta-like n=1 Tax=Schistocerca gregaria TaxID=7010 RepID=UPI00211E0708|nr:signal recognition particle receptor subunit beta-like [Schistocerca gregaria]